MIIQETLYFSIWFACRLTTAPVDDYVNESSFERLQAALENHFIEVWHAVRVLWKKPELFLRHGTVETRTIQIFYQNFLVTRLYLEIAANVVPALISYFEAHISRT